MLTYAAFFAKEKEGESSSLSALLVTLPADFQLLLDPLLVHLLKSFTYAR